MRTLTKLTACAAVLLALAGCGNDPKSGISALEAPAGSADTFPGGAEAAEGVGIAPDSTRLLVEESDYALYAARPNPTDSNELPADGVCLVVVHYLEGEQMSSSCTGNPALSPVQLGSMGVGAKLTADDYDASEELADGWRQPHKNLLVRP
jgi:hypothetical protein